MHDRIPSAPPWVHFAAKAIQHLPAGRYRALNWLCRRPLPKFMMQMPAYLGGYSFICDLRDGIARDVCFTGRYEPQETALVHAILRPGMCFVDVGANWGYFTLLAAHLVGKHGRIISFEPDPRVYRVLNENVANNDLDHIIALQIAAANEPGTLMLAGYDERGNNWGLSRLVDSNATGAMLFQVVARPLDDLLDEQGISQVDLLKMDIEGAEELALRGMRLGLAQHRYHRILLEVHPTILAERGRSPLDVFALLTQAGYRAWRVDHSVAATRRAAYARSLEPSSFLYTAKDFDLVNDAWPHQLWCAPDVKPV